ncbi:bifunctional adenosylcobinamide kinase/adenosylcobinamide-phosphate guanylyltransferase [Vreelandella salicampi]|uniref:Bifunctional adenosylcobinamide kinase/adenosylcobinamide-phosphate guanylyltransferase n=1 Tax=Vreelandella salicampi TaxID=1449798 RepID=A0A7Z0RW42_9GAMM|nr:bifunctional adenosylcobinamide kinase/adenosylcobinamide-phosphate guanylyltransferase [Halomonas salicampi]NYS62274.1 bifunctional adenosylcobinamide kinase/adenosylcobinamide-phosphate guanylyltransferase [Halomonas salicampi]
MQLFIGGACAGKRDVVSARFPEAAWCRLVPGSALPTLSEALLSDSEAIEPKTWVLTGWLAWLQTALKACPDDDALRHVLATELEGLSQFERLGGPEIVLIVPEIGRGIVPMAAEDRRLRDLAGWLAQDATRYAENTWYVRHGLVQALKG